MVQDLEVSNIFMEHINAVFSNKSRGPVVSFSFRCEHQEYRENWVKRFSLTPGYPSNVLNHPVYIFYFIFFSVFIMISGWAFSRKIEMDLYRQQQVDPYIVTWINILNFDGGSDLRSGCLLGTVSVIFRSRRSRTFFKVQNNRICSRNM